MEYSLEDVSGIGKATAERMQAAGIDTVEALASTKVEDLVKLKIKGIGKATAKKYIDSAKKLCEESKIAPKKEIDKEKKSQLKEEKEKVSKVEKAKKKEPSEKTSNIKDLIKQQAECNIGLVGHVDHGMMMLFQHFP